MPNDTLFSKYYIELRLRVQNDHNYDSYLYFLEKFKEFLGASKPSPDLAKAFVAQYHDHSRNTQVKYAAIIKGFMKFYGEPVDDLKIRRPRSAPQVVEDASIEKFLEAVSNKQSHKKKIYRDLLLFELYVKTGMRRAELANLKVKDIHDDFIMVIKGKGEKDRMVPLLPDLAKRLHKYVDEKQSNETVFGLKDVSIGNKVYNFAKKAGIDIHTHSFRHKYARDLLQKGANIRAVQELLGHSNLNTTQAYLAVTNEDLHNTVKLLETPTENSDSPGVNPNLNPSSNTASVKKTFDLLDTMTIVLSSQDLPAKDIFYALHVELSLGIKVYDTLKAIANHFGNSIKGEPVTPVNELFATYAQLNLVDLQLRREGTIHPYDEKYWILTDFGKQLLTYIQESFQHEAED